MNNPQTPIRVPSKSCSPFNSSRGSRMRNCWHQFWCPRTSLVTIFLLPFRCLNKLLPAVVPDVEPQVVTVGPPRHLITAAVCVAEAETVELAVVRSDHLIWPSVDNEVCDLLSHIEVAAAIYADCYHSLDCLEWLGVWLVWSIDWSLRWLVLFFGLFVLFWFLALFFGLFLLFCFATC